MEEKVEFLYYDLKLTLGLATYASAHRNLFTTKIAPSLVPV